MVACLVVTVTWLSLPENEPSWKVSFHRHLSAKRRHVKPREARGIPGTGLRYSPHISNDGGWRGVRTTALHVFISKNKPMTRPSQVFIDSALC